MVDLPPPTHDFRPVGIVIELILPASEVPAACNGGINIEACVLLPRTFKPGDKCVIVLPKIGPGGTSQRHQDLLRRHEWGHCNGIGGDHAGYR